MKAGGAGANITLFNSIHAAYHYLLFLTKKNSNVKQTIKKIINPMDTSIINAITELRGPLSSELSSRIAELE